MSLSRGIKINPFFFFSIIFFWHFYGLVDGGALSISAELPANDFSSSTSSSLFSLAKRNNTGAELCSTGVPCLDSRYSARFL